MTADRFNDLLYLIVSPFSHSNTTLAPIVQRQHARILKVHYLLRCLGPAAASVSVVFVCARDHITVENSYSCGEKGWIHDFSSGHDFALGSRNDE